MDDTTGRVTEIQAEIAQTRADMSETIEAIQERLTPSHLVAQAGETVRTATTEKVKQMANTAGQAADQLMDSSFAQTVRSNPIPAAMIGLGAAWLLMKGRSDSQRYSRSRWYNRPSSGEPGAGASNTGAIGTSGYGAYTSDPYTASSRTPEFGDMPSYDRDRRSGVQLDRVVRDNPLVVGAAAALVGVAIGMTVPATDAENRLMGEARDTVVDRARELAGDAAEKVQDVAARAVDATTNQGNQSNPGGLGR